MNTDSPEDSTIGASPMFRCNQKGETPKVTQIVKTSRTAVYSSSTIYWKVIPGVIREVPAAMQIVLSAKT